LARDNIFSGCKFGKRGLEALAKALESNKTLQHLGLSGNNVGDAGAQAVAKALKSNETLQRLGLGENDIGDVGAQALAKALNSNASLQRLDLWSNEIRDEGAQAIAIALESNETLQRLDLSQNEIGDGGVQAIAKALQSNATLEHLDLSHNEIGDGGVQAIAKALQKNATLHTLELDYNYHISDAELQPIELLIKRNERLKDICNSRYLLQRTKEVAIAMCSVYVPIYVLLEIVEWELALQMADAELDCVKKRFLSMESHRQRCESLDRKKRVQTIYSVCKHHADFFIFSTAKKGMRIKH